VAELVAPLRAATATAGLVLAPAALDGHAGHAAVRDAARELGRPLALYADLPHAPPGPPPAWLGPAIVHALSDAALCDKRRALRCYASQLPSLERAPLGPLTDALLRRESVWRLDCRPAP
jgi:LmbE family N-acetylglucosaminyl deacetylase